MHVKKVKKKCMVKGCRNTDCFSLTAGHEFGNTVIICLDCLKAAAVEAELYKPGTVREKPKTPPALFFSDALTTSRAKNPEKQEIPEKTLEKQETASRQSKKTTVGSGPKGKTSGGKE